MPQLDRRIIIVFSNFYRNQHGEAIAVNTENEVWASRSDIFATDTPQEGGQLQLFQRSYTIRWRRDLIQYLDDTPDDSEPMPGGPPPRLRAVVPQNLSIRDPDLNPGGLTENDLSVEDIITVAERGILRERRRFIRLTVLGEIV